MDLNRFKVGDKYKGPCEKCKAIVFTTFKEAPLRIKGRIIPDILQEFCDYCNSPISIPHQSSYKIKEFLSKELPFCNCCDCCYMKENKCQENRNPETCQAYHNFGYDLSDGILPENLNI